MRNSVTHSGLVALFALLASIPAAHSTVLNLTPAATATFDDMTDGQTIDTLTPPWTGPGASTIEAALPSGIGNSSPLAITAPGSIRLGALSPEQSLPEAFSNATTTDTLYFSAWLLHNGGGGSIVFNSNNLASGYTFTLSGFGIAEGAARNFTYLADTNGDGLPELTNSAAIAERNAWYEMALVIRLDTTNFENSLGYLYYRKTTDTEYTLLPEFENGVKMSWWSSSFNITDFAYFRIDSARNHFQIDNLSVGFINPAPNLSLRSEASVTAP